MLITRGFGTGTGEGPGGYIYVPITDPKAVTTVTGKNKLTLTPRIPAFGEREETTIPVPNLTTSEVDIEINVDNLKPKITTNTPKF